MKIEKPVRWRGFTVTEKVIAVGLPLVSIAFAFGPFLTTLIPQQLLAEGGWGSFIDRLFNGYGNWILSAAVLLVWGVFLYQKRQQLLRNQQLWYGAGCPECGRHDLTRIARRSSDRLYDLIRLPAYRYWCRDCIWSGLRVAYGKPPKTSKLAPEFERALLQDVPTTNYLLNNNSLIGDDSADREDE